MKIYVIWRENVTEFVHCQLLKPLLEFEMLCE